MGGKSVWAWVGGIEEIGTTTRDSDERRENTIKSCQPLIDCTRCCAIPPSVCLHPFWLTCLLFVQRVSQLPVEGANRPSIIHPLLVDFLSYGSLSLSLALVVVSVPPLLVDLFVTVLTRRGLIGWGDLIGQRETIRKRNGQQQQNIDNTRRRINIGIPLFS